MLWLIRYSLVISGKYETKFDFDGIHSKKDTVKDEIISAFESNEYIELAKIDEISFSRGTTKPNLHVTDQAGRSQHAESKVAVVDFTVNCILNTTPLSNDIESSIKNSFSLFVNATIVLEVEKVILISETKKILIEEHLKKTEDKKFFYTPNQTELDDIMTDENDDNCRGSNHWTEWYSQVSSLILQCNRAKCIPQIGYFSHSHQTVLSIYF